MKRIKDILFIILLTTLVVVVILGGQSCSPFKEVEATLIKKEISSATLTGKAITRLLFDTGIDTVLKNSFYRPSYFVIGDKYFITTKIKK